MKHRLRHIPSNSQQRAAPAAPQALFERTGALHQAGRQCAIEAAEAAPPHDRINA